MPYKECPNCGAHLDHGEHCDCEKGEKEDERKETANAC